MYRSTSPLVIFPVLAAVVCWIMLGSPGSAQAQADTPRLIVGTTVGLQRTGLLDVLVPLFERRSGLTVTLVAVSAPQALALGARGELDVLLIDGGDDEEPYLAQGHGLDRQLVMHADDVVVGPRDDPAGLRAALGIREALQRIVATHSDWVSRSDNSGLHQLEKELWREAGIDPVSQPWYVPLGQGMLPTLAAASERQAYALADRQTFLERQSLLDLDVASQGSPELLQLFHVIPINPAKGAWIDAAGARAFGEFLLDAEAQEQIRIFGADRFGQPIFVPDAGRTERELRPQRRVAG
jgi:tungstate transport system substrate-binding protein